MLVGVITGTYSSIFVASAIAYDWLHRGQSKPGLISTEKAKSERSSQQTAKKVATVA